jgi:hypothetical protein
MRDTHHLSPALSPIRNGGEGEDLVIARFLKNHKSQVINELRRQFLKSVLFRLLITVVVVLFGAAVGPVRGAEWQWSVTVDSVISPETHDHPRAFLWIPPDCRQVRAVVVGQHNMIEEGILEHAVFRRELAKLGMGEIWITPVLDTWQNATNNAAANDHFAEMTGSLARESGYRELAVAPVVPMGHSAMASFPWNFGAWNPARTLAMLSVHGDAPQTDMVGNGRPNVDWGGRTVDGIPGLMVMGEYEWLEGRLAPAQKFRAKYPAAPVAMLAEPGRGHFDFDEKMIRYLARFIGKAAEQRLPAHPSLDGPVLLKPIDPRQGWLVDRWRKDELPHAAAAPFARYKGDPGEAFWSFDGEMARLTQDYGSDQRGKRPQMLGYVQDGQVVPQTPGAHEQVRLKFEPLADGVTFQLGTAFLDVVPAGGNPVRWTGLTNGTPLGHATGGGPIRLSRICGPVRQTGSNTFAVSFYRMGMDNARRGGDVWLLAEQPGDATFKSAVQQALMQIPPRNTEGAEQHLTFPEIPPQIEGTQLVKLNATSDAGMPVYYYVREGPAEMTGDGLRLTKIPPQAKFPVKVTVVAWQYGRRVEPKLKSAEPVERSFCITKPMADR